MILPPRSMLATFRSNLLPMLHTAIRCVFFGTSCPSMTMSSRSLMDTRSPLLSFPERTNMHLNGYSSSTKNCSDAPSREDTPELVTDVNPSSSVVTEPDLRTITLSMSIRSRGSSIGTAGASSFPAAPCCAFIISSCRLITSSSAACRSRWYIARRSAASCLELCAGVSAGFWLVGELPNTSSAV